MVGRTQQRMTLDQEAANFLQRKAKYEVALRGLTTGRTFLFLFFIEALSGAPRRLNFESAPLFFSALVVCLTTDRSGKGVHQ